MGKKRKCKEESSGDSSEEIVKKEKVKKGKTKFKTKKQESSDSDSSSSAKLKKEKIQKVKKAKKEKKDPKADKLREKLRDAIVREQREKLSEQQKKKLEKEVTTKNSMGKTRSTEVKLGDGSEDSEEAREAEKNTRDVDFSAKSGPSKDSDRPFGLELDGALVVDLVDKGAALAAGVQIGWRVLAVDGKRVPEDDVGIAAKKLREAEMRMSNELDGRVAAVHVRFRTEDPDHWQTALQGLKGQRKRKR